LRPPRQEFILLSWIFWSLFALDAASLIYLGFLMPSRWGPEGPVGGWLLIIPPVVMAILAAAVLITNTDFAKWAGVWVLGIPWIGLVVGPIFSQFQHYATVRRLAGDDSFRRPAQRKLAHAIAAHDAALAKSLIAGAGDLNKVYRGETLLRFAVYNGHELGKPGAFPGAFEIVKALLDAGANPNIASGTSYPLTSAIPGGSEFTALLLDAGADPNRIDDAGRPLWWDVLSDDSEESLRTLDILIRHGADLKRRDREGGPVAWAAYHAYMSFNSDWRLVWLLMEHGAEWNNEQEFGRSLSDMLEYSIHYRESGHRALSEEMRAIRKRLADGH